MTLANIVKTEHDIIINGVAWLVIYKINRSWNCASFYQKSGTYEDGLKFDDDDLDEMFKITKTDSKAICINGVINGFSKDFSLSELENKIRTIYELRHSQLNGDFLGTIVEMTDYEELVDYQKHFR